MARPSAAPGESAAQRAVVAAVVAAAVVQHAEEVAAAVPRAEEVAVAERVLPLVAEPVVPPSVALSVRSDRRVLPAQRRTALAKTLRRKPDVARFERLRLQSW